MKPLTISEQKYNEMIDNLDIGYARMVNKEIKTHNKNMVLHWLILIIQIAFLSVGIYLMVNHMYVYSISICVISFLASITIIVMFFKEQKRYDEAIKIIKICYDEEVSRVNDMYNLGKKNEENQKENKE